MKRLLLTAIGLALGAMALRAQTITYPSPFALSTGSYQLSSWAAASPQGTYPQNMGFYRLDTSSDPLLVNEIYTDYDTAYNLPAGTRINGRGYQGFSFINTGNAVKKLGAAILSLNTTGRTGITVQWMGRTIVPNMREYEVRLFWRVGSSGAFTPVLGSLGDTIRYVRSATAGDSTVVGPVTLPASAEGQAEIQLEWKYFQTATNTASGTRAELAVDDISVTSSGAAFPVVTPSTTLLPMFAARVGQHSPADTFSVTGSTLTGDVTATAPANFELSLDNMSWSGSVTLTQSGGTLAGTAVYARFSPTAMGFFNGNIDLTTAGGATQQVAVDGYTIQSTNPAAHVMTSGAFSFTAWDSLSAPGTYPAAMVFHSAFSPNAPLINLPLPYDWTCGYNVPARSRFIGLDSMGIAFLNTGAPQYDYCDTLTATTLLNTFVGAAVLALNTTSSYSNMLSFNAGLVARDTTTAITQREYGLRVQYRLDSTSNFMDLSPMLEYATPGKVSGDLQSFSTALPAQFNNVPYLQLRWMYYAQQVPGASGQRPEIRLDEISVTGTLGTGNVQLQPASGNAYPNPVHAGEAIHFTQAFTGAVYDMFGRKVTTLENAKQCATNGWSAGVYLLQDTKGGKNRIVVE